MLVSRNPTYRRQNQMQYKTGCFSLLPQKYSVVAIAIDYFVFDVRFVTTQLIFHVAKLGIKLIVLYFLGCM